ncbi:MAG: hypothetical protein IJ583_08710 [Firmicutes bacterium]|nr:hypothetical protein [Bacillota bacterium]
MARKDSKLPLLKAVYTLPKGMRKLSDIAGRVNISHTAAKNIISKLEQEGYLVKYTYTKCHKESTEYELTEKALPLCIKSNERRELLYSYFVGIQGCPADTVNKYIEDTHDEMSDDFESWVKSYIKSSLSKYEKCIFSLKNGEYTIPFIIYMIRNDEPINERSMAQIAFNEPAELIAKDGKYEIHIHRRNISYPDINGMPERGRANAISLRAENGSYTSAKLVGQEYFVIPFDMISEKYSDFLHYCFLARASVSVKSHTDIDAVMAIKFDASGIRKKGDVDEPDDED